MANWAAIALLGGLTSNAGNFLFRYILKDGDDASAYAWFHEAFRLCFFVIAAIYSFKLVYSTASILALTGLGLAEFAAAYFVMKMHSHSHLSISTIISRTRLIWVPIIAFFVFGEKLNLYQYAGIIILFFGLSVAASPKRILTDKGIKYAYISAFTIALVNVFMKLAAPYANTQVMMVWMSLPSVVLFPLVMKRAKKRIATSLRKNLTVKIGTGVVNAVSMYLLTVAITMGPVSLVTALYQSMMISGVLSGILLLNEKENIAKKIIGSIITLVGVVLLTV